MSCKAFALMSALLTMGTVLLADDEAQSTKLPLRILYAGNRDSDRAKDFAAFLDRHFTKVTVADLATFKPADAEDHHVVIFDWTTIYPRDKEGKIDDSVGRISMPQVPQLTRTFSRPTVLIGAAGGQIAGSLQLKITWL